MHPRLSEEWQDLVSLYPGTTYAGSPERIELTLELSPGIYNSVETRITVLIPVGYRATGPDGFLVPSDLRLQAGALPTSDASPLGMPGWLLMSFHFMDAAGATTWKPTSDPKRGDNLIGYIEAVKAFLAAGCN
jgi:hypothetical protein